MPRRKLEDRNDVQVIFRTSAEVKARIDAEADKLGLTTADWLRAVVMEKLDGKGTDEEFENKVEQVIWKILAKKEII